MMIRRTPDEKINFSDSLKHLLKLLFKTAFIARKTYWPNLPNITHTTRVIFLWITEWKIEQNGNSKLYKSIVKWLIWLVHSISTTNKIYRYKLTLFILYSYIFFSQNNHNCMKRTKKLEKTNPIFSGVDLAFICFTFSSFFLFCDRCKTIFYYALVFTRWAWFPSLNASFIHSFMISLLYFLNTSILWYQCDINCDV